MVAQTKQWTLEELHNLPDDDNTYELIRGVLFVTPAPSEAHHDIVARLTHILVPYVTRQHLGYVYHPRAVLQYDGSQVEPDLQVRHPHTGEDSDWSSGPPASLIVEVASPSTFRRDRTEKRKLYMDAGILEYWIVDGASRTITVVRATLPDVICTEAIEWFPAGATEPLTFDLVEVFGIKEF